MNDNTAKVIAIGGLTAMGAIATAPFLGGATLTGLAAYGAWGVIGTASVIIATMKEKTPHQMLIAELRKSFKFSKKEAEEFANKLRIEGVREYFKVYDESTITRED